MNTTPLPGVDCDGCLIVLCGGEPCRHDCRSNEASVWSLLRRALQRVVDKVPLSVLITTDCLGQCGQGPSGVHVASQIRGKGPGVRSNHAVVADRADAALFCAAVLRSASVPRSAPDAG